MRKLVFKTCLLITMFVLAPISYVYGVETAQEELQFNTEYEVSYDIDATGNTSVVYNITIINTRSDIVATDYSLSIKNLELSEIKAKDEKGEMETEIQRKSNTTTILVKLNDPAIGENRKNNISISFETKNIATKVGEVWNINIPPVHNLNLANKYDVILNIPESFGPKIYTSPSPLTDEIKDKEYVIRFDKNRLNDNAVTASFGKFQAMNFDVKYQLENNSILSNYQEIALPPDLESVQKVNYVYIDPAPVRVRQDNDGNILARYKVPAKGSIEITVKGSARITGKQIAPEFGGAFSAIPKKLARTYTEQDTHWETLSPNIKAIAGELKNEDLTVAQNAQRVYEYVINKLDYNFQAQSETFVTRKGAENALLNPELSACMEYSDLFVAITRAMGIPSRNLNGYAFNGVETNLPLSINLSGGDYLHSWPEFYDPEFGWVQVDPTWADTSGIDFFTKLDTHHFTLAINGLDSELPLPAGAYRVESGDSNKLIDIQFSAQEIDENTLPAYEQAQKFVVKQKLLTWETITAVIAAVIVLGVLLGILVYPEKTKGFLTRLRHRS